MRNLFDIETSIAGHSCYKSACSGPTDCPVFCGEYRGEQICALQEQLSSERQAREKAEKALEYMTLKAKGACGKCKFDSDSLRAEIASTKDDLRVMTDLYHSNRRCQCSDEDCCAYEREKEALRAELAEVRGALRVKTEELQRAVEELRRVQEQSLAWFQDSANKDAQLKELEAALASSQAHHAYDNERHAAAWHKLEVRLSAVHGNIPPRPICASHSMISAEHQHNLWDSVVEMDSAWDEMTKALAPSTPQEAEAWARSPKSNPKP